MSDELIREKIELIIDSVDIVLKRMERINNPSDLIDSPEGITILDSISMRLQIIGEQTKAIFKINPLFFNRYSEIEWQKIIRFRDFVSHHYEDLDYEIIYDICKNDLQLLYKSLQKIISDFSAQ
ncbi:MAG: DUF86 domain-containing protein [Ignavibacteriaceae bacterium]|nr:DUF86 domain-containing protein [Ignavibacteriaceae bacterium]